MIENALKIAIIFKKEKGRMHYKQNQVFNRKFLFIFIPSNVLSHILSAGSHALYRFSYRLNLYTFKSNMA